MRYYTTEYRNELNSALTNMVSALDDSYTSAINAVEECGTENIDCYKYDALDVANRACASVEALTEQINSVSTQLMAFYDHVDEIADMMKSDAETIIEILDMTNNAISNLCDLLNGVGSFENQPVTSYNIGVACEPMSGVEEKRKQFLNDYYLDENGLVDQAAVSRTCDTINESYDAEAEDGEQFSSIGNTTADMYAEFVFDYTSREDLTDEMMESLLNANMAAGMAQDTDSPAPDVTITEIDGTDYYIVNFPYESTPALDTINDRVYQLNLERYRQTCDEQGNTDAVNNTSLYLDTMRTLTMDHVSVPQLIPCSDVDLDNVNTDMPLASSLEAPEFPNIITYSSGTDAFGDPYATVTFDLPVDDPNYKVVFFSTENVYYSTEYDRHGAPLTGDYPSGLYPFSFYYPCDSFDVFSNRSGLVRTYTELDDNDFDELKDNVFWADLIECYQNNYSITRVIAYLFNKGVYFDIFNFALRKLSEQFGWDEGDLGALMLVLETAGSIAEAAGAVEVAALSLGIGAEVLFAFGLAAAIIGAAYVAVQTSYQENMDIDYENFVHAMNAAAHDQNVNYYGGNAVLHSGDREYDMGAFYYETYSPSPI